MIKSYLVNGFMDAGKTTFIKNLLKQDYFRTGEKTLLLLCEEGEEEYDVDELQRNQVYIAEIDKEEDFNPDYILKLEQPIRPMRVIIEYNGMWKRGNLQFPWYWDPPIEIAVFHAETFDIYSKNMKALVAEQVRDAAMTIFNRCDGLIDKLPSYRRCVRAVNTGINVVFEDKNGTINSRFDEDLPYDITKPEIEITEDTYSVFYLDAMENVERYIGKRVSLIGMVMKKTEDKPGMFVLGRFAMTCCAADLTLFGFICDYEKTGELELDDWVSIQAIVEKDYTDKYQLWYPVLRVQSCCKCEEPEKDVVEVL